jgi:CDP-diacylglycerol--serine O-phosphatidyltransferase
MKEISNKGILKSIQLIPNAITAFGLTCGLFIIFKMVLSDFSTHDTAFLQTITGLFLLAAFADILDGILARLMHAESEFGIFFDSLSDAITFGVAPSVVVLKTLTKNPDAEITFLLSIGAIIYSLCGVLRLVRYSVQAWEAKDNHEKLQNHNKNFIGLPIPAAAGGIISLNLFLISPECQQWFAFSDKTRIFALTFIMPLLGYFMISNWKFPSIKALHFRVHTFQLVAITAVIAALTLYGILHHFVIVFLITSWSYIIIAWLLSFTRLIVGKKSKTLEDFDPEED